MPPRDMQICGSLFLHYLFFFFGQHLIDPEKYPDAKRLPKLTYMDALRMQLKVMDAAAFSLCQENKIPIIVFDVNKKGNLRKLLLEGEEIGSVVSDQA
jgi:uridylate kinase